MIPYSTWNENFIKDNVVFKGPDSDGCVDRDLPDVDSTIPKEIASNKVWIAVMKYTY